MIDFFFFWGGGGGGAGGGGHILTGEYNRVEWVGRVRGVGGGGLSTMACQNRKVLEYVFHPDRAGRFHRLAGSEFQTDGAIKLNRRSPKDFTLRYYNVTHNTPHSLTLL